MVLKDLRSKCLRGIKRGTPREYVQVFSELSIKDELLMQGSQIVESVIISVVLCYLIPVIFVFAINYTFVHVHDILCINFASPWHN